MPEKLLNKTLLLRDVCRFWNNLFARAFETTVTSSAFMREVLLEFTPVAERPRGVVYLGPVETERQKTEHRWLVDGQPKLREMPNRTSASVVAIDAFDAAGDRHPVEVRLPFSITTGGTGDEHFVEEVRKRLGKERRKILEYFTSLARNPAQDPALFQHLQDRGLHLREPKGVDVDEVSAARAQGGLVDDVLQKLYALDPVPWTRFYMKVAWCFGCLKLGRPALQELGGDAVLNYLRAEAVPPELVTQVRAHDAVIAEKLFRDASIDGSIVWLWRVSVAEGQQILGGPEPPGLALLSRELERRNGSPRRGFTLHNRGLSTEQEGSPVPNIAITG